MTFENPTGVCFDTNNNMYETKNTKEAKESEEHEAVAPRG